MIIIFIKMSSVHSQIKSKKEKMMQKRNVKGRLENEVIQVIQSDEQIQKRITTSKKIEKIQKIQTKIIPNSFNLNRLKKAQLPPYVPQDELKVQISCEPNYQSTNQVGRKLLMYKTQGSNATRYTSTNSMKEKIDQQNKDKQAIDDSPQNSEGQAKNGTQKERRTVRYFSNTKIQELSSDSDQIVCYRCHQKGHIARNCPEEAQKIKCNFCLKCHPTNECDSSLCFKCGQNDHVAEQCKSSSSRCSRCGKAGHKQKNCGVVVFLEYDSRRVDQMRERYETSDLTKLKCMAKCSDPRGHFNCEKYNKKIPLPYEVVAPSRNERHLWKRK